MRNAKWFRSVLVTLSALLFMSGCASSGAFSSSSEDILAPITSEIEDLDSRIEELEDLYDYLIAVVDEQNDTLVQQADEILANAAEIAALEATVTALQATVALQATTITTLQTALDASAALIAQNILDIDALQTDVTTLDALMDATTTQIDILEGMIDSLETVTDTLTSQLATHTTTIANLEALIATLTTRINDLETALANLEMATSIQISYTQVGESLSAKIDLVLPDIPSNEGFDYVGAKLELNHPLKATVTSNPFVKEVSYDETETTLEFDVLYHGLYEGELTLEYSDGTMSKYYDFTLDLPLKASHYNVAWLNATMPLLLFASDMYTGYYDSGFTYIEIERARTFDYTKLPANVKPIPAYASPSLGNYDQTMVANFYESIDSRTNKAYAVAWLEELYALDDTSTFTFATVDNVGIVITSVYYSNIPVANVDFVVYTDGSYSVWMLNEVYSGATGYDNYVSRKAEFLDWETKVISHEISTTYNPVFILPAVESSNYRYVINSGSGLEFVGDMATKYAALGVEEVAVTDAFDAVETAGKLNDLEFLLKTRWGDAPEQSMSSYFTGLPAKNLLILGTSPAAEANALYATFEKYIDYIVATYGAEYKIFYKGHPRYPSDVTRQAMFADKDITELENSIPVETLMLLYDDVYVGGYTSTSFQSSLVGQTIFFFGPQSLIEGNATLKSMIAAGIIFEDTVYLIKDAEGDVIIEV